MELKLVLYVKIKQTGEVIISLIENQEGSSIYDYCACDSQYNITEELPKEFIDTYYDDDTRVPLTYQITADGLLTITNFGHKETIVTASVDLQGGEISCTDDYKCRPNVWRYN